MRAISPYNTKLDKHNAYWMARIAEAVYECTSDCDQLPNEAKILAGLKQDDDGFRSVMGVDKNSAQAALVEHDDYLCMAFRGTNELADWLDNLNAFSTPQLFGEFHRGFWLCCEDVWAPMFARCLQLQGEKKRPVFLTGHSLGGAMATIAAAHFVQMDKPFTSVYTFGQPRAMTRETAQIFNMECKSRFFRFHNNNDIVTRVPARVMGYSHIGRFLKKKKFIANQVSGFVFLIMSMALSVICVKLALTESKITIWANISRPLKPGISATKSAVSRSH